MPTKIEWAQETWNPITGCTKISEGCENCYAERMSKRLAGRCGYPKDDPFQVTLHRDKAGKPLKWRKPRKVFVCSMGDLFHRNVDFVTIHHIFQTAAHCQQHKFIILTKRPHRMLEFTKWMAGNDDASIAEWPRNCWLGVTAENQKRADERIPILLDIPAAVRFVSVEPMLGEVDIRQYSKELDWVICGGESGPGARPMHPDWVRSLRDQCVDAGTPFMFKQWGGWVPGNFDKRKGKMVCEPIIEGERVGKIFWTNPGHPKINIWDEKDHYWTNASALVGKKKAGRLLDGKTWDQYPDTERR